MGEEGADKFRGHRNHAKFMVSIKSFTISVHLRHKQAASGKWQAAGVAGAAAGAAGVQTQYGNELGQKAGPKKLVSFAAQRRLGNGQSFDHPAGNKNVNYEKSLTAIHWTHAEKNIIKIDFQLISRKVQTFSFVFFFW